jgi:hypothetical protein
MNDLISGLKDEIYININQRIEMVKLRIFASDYLFTFSCLIYASRMIILANFAFVLCK